MQEDALTSRIGNTPLLELKRLRPRDSRVRLFVKAEGFNPGGSVKDRAAWRIVRDALERGLLGKGQATTLVDASSGNTGIAYAMLGASLGFPVRIYLPSTASPERKRLLKVYGAETVLTDPLEGSDGAIRAVKALVEKEGASGRWFYADQYSNPLNPLAHYEGTAEEIWRQTGGKVTHFIAGLGTSGTFCGTTRRLKELNPAIQCISFQPDGPFHGLEGMKHMASALVPAVYDARLADRDLACSAEDAHAMCRRLAREEGILAGISSGAAVTVALRVAAELDAGLVVAMLPDGGDRYLSEEFWEASC